MLKKLGIFAVLLAFVTFVGFHFVKVNAEGETLQMVPGASIRTSGTQGLKFSATFDETVLGQTRGFFIIYGEATIAQLQSAITGGTPYEINGKEVKIASVYDATSPTISVVLTGIPIGGYNQQLTVIGFTQDASEVYTFVPTVVTRSIAQVALNAAKAGDSASVSGVLTDLSSNYFKHGWDEFGNYVISSSIYEYDRVQLRTQFIADWNTFAGTTWTSLEKTSFFANAKLGLTDDIKSNTDLSNSNIYKFFNDAVFGLKWGWLLDHITSVDGTTHPSRQIVAIKGNGTNGAYVLYHADQLSHSIVNFFNKSYVIGGYTAIDFTATSGTKYDNVSTYNNKVFAEYSSYEFVKSGNTITIPAAPAKENYNFVSYSDGVGTVGVGPGYTVNAIKKLTPQYTAISYTITYFDGETSLTDLNRTYTVENAVTLANYVKEGYTFDGWYDNAEFTGSVITSFPSGTSGNKVYYAKTTSSAFVPVEVTYDLNGGQLNSTDLYGVRDSETKVIATRYKTSTTFINGNDITINTNSRASWNVIGLKPTGVSGIYEVLGTGPNYTHAEATLYFMMHDTCTSVYKSTWLSKYNTLVVGSLIIIENIPSVEGAGYSIDVYFIAASEATADVVTTLQESTSMLAPVRLGYSFGGWCELEDCSDTPITTYPGFTAASGVTTKTYYAKWIAD